MDSNQPTVMTQPSAPAPAPIPPRESRGGHGKLIIIVLSVSLGLLVILAGWLYFSYRNQKENVDEITVSAVEKAKANQAEELEADFAEREKNPFRKYESDDILGSIVVEFPKTWNLMVAEDENSSVQIDATFHPGKIDISSEDNNYALRMQLVDELYTQTVSEYEGNVEEGLLKSKSITVSGASGLIFNGLFPDEKVGRAVVLPVRDSTLILRTDSDSFLEDFHKVIEKLTFSP